MRQISFIATDRSNKFEKANKMLSNSSDISQKNFFDRFEGQDPSLTSRHFKKQNVNHLSFQGMILSPRRPLDKKSQHMS